MRSFGLVGCSVAMLLAGSLSLGCDGKSKQCRAALTATKGFEKELSKARELEELSESKWDELNDQCGNVKITDEQLDILWRAYCTRMLEHASSIQMLLELKKSDDPEEWAKRITALKKDGAGKVESLQELETYCEMKAKDM